MMSKELKIPMDHVTEVVSLSCDCLEIYCTLVVSVIAPLKI